MGYGIIGYKRKTDDISIISIQCQYGYQPVFKECFGKDIKEFNGRVTKVKINEFNYGVKKFIDDPKHCNLDSKMHVGNIANERYSSLCLGLLSLLGAMINNEVKYLSIQ